MSVQTCPPEDRLRALLGGKLPSDSAASLSRHLQECPNCTQALDRLRGAGIGATLAPANRPASGTATSVSAVDATLPPMHDPLATGPISGCDESLSFLSPPQQPDEIGRLGPYRVLKVLGQGGMGMVLQAEDPRLNRLCALKVMLPDVARRPEMKERFLREARAAAQIEHDHIIPIYQVDEDRGVPFIAMPFLKGSSLEEWLEKKTAPRGEPASVPQILKLGREIARGLAAAHERGLIHRDIKPANIWLDTTAGGRVKILDFGLARLANRGNGEEKNLTQTGMIVGTPAYMAPEQAQGQQGKVDVRTDLFALGCILYRLCTSVAPFKGDDLISTLVSVAMDHPPAPAQINDRIPLALSDLVMKLLEKDPANRPASAQDVVKALQAVDKEPQSGRTAPAMVAPPLDRAADKPPATVREPAPKRQRPESRRRTPGRARSGSKWNPGLLIGLGAAAIVAVIAGIVLFWETPKGTVRIEINDPSVKVAIDRDAFTIQGAEKHDIKLRAGPHGVRVQRGDFEFESNKFVVKKGETVVLKVELLAGQVQVAADGQVIGTGKLPQARASATAAPTKSAPVEAPSVKPPERPIDPVTARLPIWGEVIDPARDSQITGDGRKVSIEVPGTLHDLIAGGNSSSPRILRDVTGDFVAQVKVATAIRSEVGSMIPGLEGGAFRSGGLLVWKDETTFIRFERVSRDIDGKVWPLCWLELYKDNIPAQDAQTKKEIFWNKDVPDQLTHLRIERRRGVFSPSYSQDGGKTWTPHGSPFVLNLPPNLKVGVSVVNNTTKPLKVEFEDFQVMPISNLVAAAPTKSFKNSLNMEFVLIPAGKFLMGTTPVEVERLLTGLSTKAESPDFFRSESPMHEVEITRPFYLGTHHVTVGQFRQFVSEAKYAVGDQKWLNPGRAQTDDHPVVYLTWRNAIEFCSWLNRKEGRKYRLPTEAEWEYSARSGRDRQRFSFGSNFTQLAEYGWFAGNSGGITHPVGRLKANPWGLYDMHGNAWQWCQDHFDAEYYKSSPKEDPHGGSRGERVLRGGAFDSNPLLCRSAFRNHALGSTRGEIGFRVVLETPGAP